MQKATLTVIGIVCVVIWACVISLLIFSNSSSSSEYGTEQLESPLEYDNGDLDKTSPSMQQTNAIQEMEKNSTSVSEGLKLIDVQHLVRDGFVSIDNLLEYVKEEETFK